MRVASASVLAVTLLVAPAASALGPEDTTERYETGRLALGVEFSPLGGPVGLLGLVADVPLIPELSIMGGAGLGSASPQFAAGLRPRLPISTVAAASVSVSYSYGDYVQFAVDAGGSDPWTWRDASWVNVELGVDMRFANHVMVRPYFGAGKVVHSSPVTRHTGSMAEPAPHQWKAGLAYTGVAVGVWF